MSPRLILFLAVFLLNIIPAFAPPTWMVFSFLGFRFPSRIDWSFALVGALAAATGRSVLGKLSRTIVRNHSLSEAVRKNVCVCLHSDRLESLAPEKKVEMAAEIDRECQT
jgi:hypothetical protein